MKKIILLAAVLLGALANAQTSDVTIFVGEEDITNVNDYVYTTSAIGNEAGSEVAFSVTNDSDHDIYVKLKMNSMQNADNQTTEFGVQFCFGQLCFFTVEVNDVVPAELNNALIEAGSHNSNGDHFKNSYTGDVAGEDVVYNMSFVEFDSEGNEVGVLKTFTYRYSPTAGLNDFTALKNAGISVKNTVVKNGMELTANQNAKLALYSVNGQLVKSAAIVSGTQSVDMSYVATGIYIARFTTTDNKTAQIRIVKN
jgi:hypothetical protein